ncbi:AbrB/MazE/SpoVT family DNA-binding domain-containing protein [Promicromonospora thailandica]|uniref:Looped-hinge helix DNA binding domain-containing protein, AbrB family n=1 Tax=Promicromonospora thailandica TaxID=765201 RepID=A0A9X2G1I6_9MICO|nr:AbrB/MazE/SpoVT family DNA-binding domain-containing protein [Promicromonospora thailandica]MCP2263562.1 looped-hinge helix DNA binding domain-containing protein, AbrB family [Promicromonospora thailandica]
MTILTLRPKNQVTVPKEIAEAAGLHVGDALDFSVVDGSVVISKVELGRPVDTPRPSAEDWLAAADYVGERDRELLNRLAQ